MAIEDELFPDLPEDLEGPAPAFKPYKYRIKKAHAYMLLNALPIVGLILAVVL